MGWEVEYSDEFGHFWDALDEATQDQIDRSVRLLEDKGPNLGYPHSSAVNGSRHGHMRELRVQVSGKPYRIFYAFDTRRAAILLIGGNKAGAGDKRFYERLLPMADGIYDAHLVQLAEEDVHKQHEDE